MTANVIASKGKRNDIVRALRALPGLLAGRRGPNEDIVRGLKLRIGMAFLSKVKQAYIVKSRGGRDEAGIKWPPLTQGYLAYGRGPFSTRKAGRYAPGIVVGGPRNGQQKDGFMTPKQLAEWKKIFAQSRLWLIDKVGAAEASNRAAAIAWSRMKAQGVRTKWDVFGARSVEILRDRGILLNSLSPGVADIYGRYSGPEGQVAELGSGYISVGTNVPYAAYHHYAKNPSRRRRLWPNGDYLPTSWREAMSKEAAKGIALLIREIARAA